MRPADLFVRCLHCGHKSVLSDRALAGYTAFEWRHLTQRKL